MCPNCHKLLGSDGICQDCGYVRKTASVTVGSTTALTSTSTTSTSSNTITTGGTIPPRYVSEVNPKFEFTIEGRHYQIENLDENMNVAFLKLHEVHFQNRNFDWDNFTQKAVAFLDENPDDYTVHDNFFENFTIIWEDYVRKELYNNAKDLWVTVLGIAKAWENANQGALLHKGTPFFYLARTYRKIGDLDFTFVYTYNAIEEDKRAVPNDYRTRPAYMYASLVDDVRSLMYDYVHEMKTKIEDYIGKYQIEMSSTFSYSDFERKFLHSNLEDVAHFFVYNLEVLIKYSGLPEQMLETDFSKLKNLDTIFHLCSIVDKVLEEKFHRGTLGGNLIELITLKSWGRRPRAHEFSQLFNFDTKGSPDTVVPALLNQQLSYDNNPMSRAMQLMVLVWYLRNFGGHHIEAKNALTNLYPEIIKAIMYALFISVETL